MKHKDLIKILLKNNVVLDRYGSNHDWYKNKITGKFESVPRHKEINEYLAKKIIKNLKR